MSLFDTKKGFYEWKAEAILAWRTTDEAIENIKPTEKTNLIWTKSGAVFGYRSQEPTGGALVYGLSSGSPMLRKQENMILRLAMRSQREAIGSMKK